MAVAAALSKGYDLDYMWRQTGAPGVVRDTPGGGLYVPGIQARLESLASTFPGMSRVPDMGQGPR